MIFVDYECPNCDALVETPVPEPGDYFDTLVICPGCGELHFRLVASCGHVTTKMIVNGKPSISECTIYNAREVKHG